MRCGTELLRCHRDLPVRADDERERTREALLHDLLRLGSREPADERAADGDARSDQLRYRRLGSGPRLRTGTGRGRVGRGRRGRGRSRRRPVAVPLVSVVVPSSAPASGAAASTTALSNPAAAQAENAAIFGPVLTVFQCSHVRRRGLGHVLQAAADRTLRGEDARIVRDHAVGARSTTRRRSSTVVHRPCKNRQPERVGAIDGSARDEPVLQHHDACPCPAGETPEPVGHRGAHRRQPERDDRPEVGPAGIGEPVLRIREADAHAGRMPGHGPQAGDVNPADDRAGVSPWRSSAQRARRGVCAA